MACVVRAGQEHLRLCTTNLVVAETHALFLARKGRQPALRFLRELRNSTTTIIRVTAADDAATVTLLERYNDKDFSYTDASSFVVMRRFGIEEALTSDRHFMQFGFRQARG